MDKDKIIKLIRLANNNPNDNEANLAARMACKMLGAAEKEFLSGPVRTAADKMNEHASNYGGYGVWGSPTGRSGYDYEEALRQRREQRAAQERAARQARDAERIRQAQEREKQKKREEENQKHYSAYNYSFDEEYFRKVYNIPYEPDFGVNINYKTGKEKRDRVRECTKCGLKTSTYSNLNPFICGICSSVGQRTEKNDGT